MRFEVILQKLLIYIKLYRTGTLSLDQRYSRIFSIENIEVEILVGNFRLTLIIHFRNKLLFLRVCSTNLKKSLWEKGERLVMSSSSFSHGFLPFGELPAIFFIFKFVVYEIFSFEFGSLIFLFEKE